MQNKITNDLVEGEHLLTSADFCGPESPVQEDSTSKGVTLIGT